MALKIKLHAGSKKLYSKEHQVEQNDALITQANRAISANTLINDNWCKGADKHGKQEQDVGPNGSIPV